MTTTTTRLNSATVVACCEPLGLELRLICSRLGGAGVWPWLAMWCRHRHHHRRHRSASGWSQQLDWLVDGPRVSAGTCMLGKQIFDCDDAANGIGIYICVGFSAGWGFSAESDI